MLVRIRSNGRSASASRASRRRRTSIHSQNSACTPFAAIRGGFAAWFVQVGGPLPGEGNLFGPNASTARAARRRRSSHRPMRTCRRVARAWAYGQQGNRYLGLQGMALGPGGQWLQPAAALAQRRQRCRSLSANRGQNFPTISAFAVAGSQVDLTYRVDSATGNSGYPLSVEFLMDDGHGNPDADRPRHLHGGAGADRQGDLLHAAGWRHVGSERCRRRDRDHHPRVFAGPSDNASGARPARPASTRWRASRWFRCRPRCRLACPSRCACARSPRPARRSSRMARSSCRRGSTRLRNASRNWFRSAAARTSEGECPAGHQRSARQCRRAYQGYNAALAAFALPNGGSPPRSCSR